MFKKGISMTFSGEIGVLITLALIVIMIVLFFSRYLDVHEVIQESAVERQSLNLGHALLSYEKLAYNDGTFIHRGIFELENIEKQFDLDNKDERRISTDFGYPNAIIVVGVKEFDSPNREWVIKFKGPSNPEASSLNGYITCLWNKLDADYARIFNIFFRKSFWFEGEIIGCAEAYDVSSHGTSTKIFPVGIKEGDYIHSGALYVTINEAWTPEETFEEEVSV